MREGGEGASIHHPSMPMWRHLVHRHTAARDDSGRGVYPCGRPLPTPFLLNTHGERSRLGTHAFFDRLSTSSHTTKHHSTPYNTRKKSKMMMSKKLLAVLLLAMLAVAALSTVDARRYRRRRWGRKRHHNRRRYHRSNNKRVSGTNKNAGKNVGKMSNYDANHNNVGASQSGKISGTNHGYNGQSNYQKVEANPTNTQYTSITNNPVVSVYNSNTNTRSEYIRVGSGDYRYTKKED